MQKLTAGNANEVTSPDVANASLGISEVMLWWLQIPGARRTQHRGKQRHSGNELNKHLTIFNSISRWGKGTQLVLHSRGDRANCWCWFPWKFTDKWQNPELMYHTT